MAQQMFYIPGNRSTLFVMSVSIFGMILARGAIAQEADSAESVPSLEEIVVVAPRYESPRDILAELRDEIVEAEDHVFELFNVLNDDDDFDVHCREETVLGTNVPQRVCRTATVSRLTQEALRQWKLDGNGPYIAPTSEIRHHQQNLDERLTSLGMEHPELSEAMIHHHLLKQEYDAKRKELLAGKQQLDDQ